MAAAEEGIKHLQKLFECVVCLDKYTDPRLLQCGHQFCSKCLEGVLLQHETRRIPCPSCRHITNLRRGKTVSDLPRPVLLNEVQEKIADIMNSSNKPKDTTLCDLCVDEKVTASFYCAECDQNFCVTCKGRHEDVEDIEGHAALPIDKFCVWHRKKKIVKYCRECNCFVCARCILGDHHKHEVYTIPDAIKRGRGQMTELTTQLESLDEDMEKAQQIKLALAELEDCKRNFHAAVSIIRHLLKDLETKLDIIESGTEKKFAAEIQSLSVLQSEAECLIVSKKSLLERARYLLDTASEQELVLQGKTLPTLAEMGSIGHIPEIDTMKWSGDFLEKLKDNLQRNAEVLNLAILGSSLYKADPIADLVLLCTYETENYVTDLAADLTRQRLVFRTLDMAAPIKVCDHTGQIQTELGANVGGIIDDDRACRSVDIDTKRDMYLVPCQSALDLLDTRGAVESSIPVGSYLRGVAYSREDDAYILSDVATNQIIVIDADTKQVITQFGSRGASDTQFERPSYVCVGKPTGVTPTAIVISDSENHNIKVFDMSGTHIKTYGSKGPGDGQLQSPRGVAIDPAGRIIVADGGNRRVVTYWTDGEQDQWRCLLGEEQLGGEPWSLAFDPVSRNLSVEVGNAVSSCVHEFKV